MSGVQTALDVAEATQAKVLEDSYLVYVLTIFVVVKDVKML